MLKILTEGNQTFISSQSSGPSRTVRSENGQRFLLTCNWTCQQLNLCPPVGNVYILLLSSVPSSQLEKDEPWQRIKHLTCSLTAFFLIFDRFFPFPTWVSQRCGQTHSLSGLRILGLDSWLASFISHLPNLSTQMDVRVSCPSKAVR